jgi:hypothetical protein
MMQIKNKGNQRIRLDKALYIMPGETLHVSSVIGEWAVKSNKEVVDVTPIPKSSHFRPNPTILKTLRGE